MNRIYKYGLPFGPDEDVKDAVVEQIWLAHRYYNQLIEVEKARRDAYWATMLACTEVAEVQDKISAANKEIASIRESISKDNAKSRKRSVSAEEKKKLKALKAERRKRYEERQKLCAKLLKTRPALKQQIDEQAERAGELIRYYRANNGVFWGTYLLIEAQVDAAKKSGELKFKRWKGDGRIGVQIQNDMDVDRLFSGKDTYLQLVEPPADTWSKDRSYRRKHSRTRVKLRIGSKKRKPIWSGWSVIMHRPLPDGAKIKWAWCQRKRIGTRWRWELCLSLKLPDPPAIKHDGGVCGIDVGWRLRADGYRIAYLVGDDGYSEEIILPKALVDKFEHTDALRSIRDANYEEIKRVVLAWAKTHSAPDWLRQMLRGLPQSRSQKKLTSIVYEWAKNRFDGDSKIYEKVEAWRRQERHLYQWEASERVKAQGQRRELYRLTARRVTERYSTLIVEDIDLSKLAQRAKPEEEEELHATSRSQRQLACVSGFKEALALMASNCGATIIEVPAKRTTMNCHECGETCIWDQGGELTHICEHCGASWDQDANAARNLLKKLELEEAAAE